MAYREPRVRVLNVTRNDVLWRITVEFVDLERSPFLPLAPASLLRDDDPEIGLVNLHRLVALDGQHATFETVAEDQPRVSPGDIVVYRGWWTREQLEVARD